MEKRGLSSIVASVLIILLVIVAIGIVWGILKPPILKSSQEVNFNLLTVNMQVDRATPSENLISLKLSRQAGQGQVDKIRVVISNETSSEVKSVAGLEELESRTYSIETSIGNASKIEIAPILMKNGEEKVGLKSDEYILRRTAGVETPEIPPVLACPTGLVSYWKFDENSGTKTVDHLGKNNGTLNILTGLSWVPGKQGNALNLFGGYVDVGNDASLNIRGSLSLEAWINASAQPMTGNVYYNLLAKEGSYSTNGYGLGIHGYYPRLEFWIKSSSTRPINTWYYGGHANIAGKWIHIASTYDEGTIKLYINGTLVSTTPNLVNPGDTLSYPLRVGYSGDPYSSYDRVFYGVVDEVSIWNKSLSQEEILEHYNLGIGKELC